MFLFPRVWPSVYSKPEFLSPRSGALLKWMNVKGYVLCLSVEKENSDIILLSVVSVNRDLYKNKKNTSNSVSTFSQLSADVRHLHVRPFSLEV